MVKNILVLGGGSAGLLAAISIKIKVPQIHVRVVRSKEIGIIGVGEGTTPGFNRHVFDFLGIRRAPFYKRVRPVWKLGIRFLWGPRERFDYTFNQQLDSGYGDLPKPNGYYCEEEFCDVQLSSALMNRDRAWARQPNGAPNVQEWHGFHLENTMLVDTLEQIAREAGVEFTDATVRHAERGPAGIAALHLEDGRSLTADLFVDASGFRSELLGKALETPFQSFEKALFCDRAVVAGWDRQPDEPILPFTTAETMDAGWAWKIEHEEIINRGYVYSSAHISDDDACAEFLRKNPRIKREPRIVKFRSGSYREVWRENVVAVGNATGFVEPLEASALMVICSQCETIVQALLHSDRQVGPSMRRFANRHLTRQWENVRDFLAFHYKFNTRLNTPFWQHARAETDISPLEEMMTMYFENGPTGLLRYALPNGPENDFGIEGYLVMLLGMKVPWRHSYAPAADEFRRWQSHVARNRIEAQTGLTVEESLRYVHDPRWTWNDDPAFPGNGTVSRQQALV